MCRMCVYVCVCVACVCMCRMCVYVLTCTHSLRSCVFRVMLGAFLKSGVPRRFALVSGPSWSAITAIEQMWANGHTVFPISGDDSRYLVHSLVEAKIEAIVCSQKDSLLCVEANKSLGIPLLNLLPCGKGASAQHRLSVQRRLILQGGPFAVSRAAYISPESWSAQIVSNGSVLQNAGLFLNGQVLLPLSKNWLLDFETFSDTNTVCLDIADSVCRYDDHSLIVTVDKGSLPQYEEFACKFPKDHTVVFDMYTESDYSLLPLLKSKEVWLRFVRGEIGPLAPLYKWTQTDPTQMNSELFTSPPIQYLNRRTQGETTTPILKPDVFASANAQWTSKRTIMQPDWRVRKVPMAVYHKKRGGKGQIYYTTKHKGWTFYKSRY